MKKTLITIAVTAALASGSAFACSNGSCGWGAAETSASTGAFAGSAGNGISIVGSSASASNVTGASQNYSYGGRDNNVGVISNAFSNGTTSATSFGITVGNAVGLTGASAYQHGTANAGNSVGNSAGASSHVDQGSGASTTVFGTGIAMMDSSAGAWNTSGAAAKADVDRLCNGCTIIHTSVDAGTMGGSYANADGLVIGQAAGVAGADAFQSGNAYANGSAEQGWADYRYYGRHGYSHPYQQADASVNASTAGGSEAFVDGAGLFAGSSHHSQLSGAVGDASALVKVCPTCSVKSLSDSKAFSKSKGYDDWDLGGVAIGNSGGYGKVNASGTTDVDVLYNPSYYGNGYYGND